MGLWLTNNRSGGFSGDHEDEQSGSEDESYEERETGVYHFKRPTQRQQQDKVRLFSVRPLSLQCGSPSLLLACA